MKYKSSAKSQLTAYAHIDDEVKDEDSNITMQVFDDVEDYDYFLELFEIKNKREKVEVHAYFPTTYACPPE